jgi:hypothetical protein
MTSIERTAYPRFRRLTTARELHVSPYLTEHVNRFGVCSTHETGIAPEDYDTRLDVDFGVLEDDQAPAA